MSIPVKDQCCGNCNAWLPQPTPTSPDDGMCRAVPPSPLLIGVQQAKLQLGGGLTAQPVIASFFPPMTRIGWCGAWKQLEGK